MRVLVVDDDHDFRAVLRATLDRDDRFEVIDEAADGNQAIALASLHQPDVVVLDLMMPELDGLAAASIIRDQTPSALIVMLSSREARTAERPAVAAGADLLIDKQRTAEVPDLIATLFDAHRV